MLKLLQGQVSDFETDLGGSITDFETVSDFEISFQAASDSEIYFGWVAFLILR